MEENFHALGQGVVNTGEGSEAMGVEGWEGGGATCQELSLIWKARAENKCKFFTWTAIQDRSSRWIIWQSMVSLINPAFFAMVPWKLYYIYACGSLMHN